MSYIWKGVTKNAYEMGWVEITGIIMSFLLNRVSNRFVQKGVG